MYQLSLVWVRREAGMKTYIMYMEVPEGWIMKSMT